MRSDRILGVYRLTFAALIAAMSVETMTYARSLADHHFWLAALEILGCILLAIRATQRLGLGLLLAVFSVAAIHNLATGGLPFDLILFGASATAIVMLDRAIR